MNKFALQKEIDRWYPLIDHAEQLKLVGSKARFKITAAGRRSGKTERAKRFLVKHAMKSPGMKFFAGAPTFAQVKDIFWEDLKLFSFSSTHAKRPSESEYVIYFDNGATISLVSFDKPQRFEGVEWSGGIIDEFGDLKEEAWDLHIGPALDTFNPTRPDYKPWCWLFGVPEGLNHFYKLFRSAQSGIDSEWEAFTWKSSEILPPDRIEAAKRRMSEKQFRQEYEASFETATGKIYESYSLDNNCTGRIQPHELICWSHDQNFTPLSSCISVIRDGCVYILDEIVLESAVSKNAAIEFVEKYKDHKNKTVHIYGDPAGRQGEKHGHASDYTDIEDILKASGWKYVRKVKIAAPSIKDRQNSVRAMIQNAKGDLRLFVNPKTAPWCDEGLATVQTKDGSSFQEDQRNKYQHITTAIGYFIDYEFPINDPYMPVGVTFRR